MKLLLIIPVISLLGCSTLGGMALKAVSPSQGIEATAQVGTENNKGAVVAKLDLSKSREVGDIEGSATIDSGNIFNYNAPFKYTILAVLMAWCVRTPFGMFMDFYRVRRNVSRKDPKGDSG